LRARIAAQTNKEEKAPITTESGRGFKLFLALSNDESQDARLLSSCWQLM
jgi:hypothetical protein